MWKDTGVLVSGGAGFIGSHIVHQLHKQGARVRVLDNLSTGYRKNLKDIEDHVEVMEGDIRNPDQVNQAMDGISVVYHQAALPSVQRSVDDPQTTHDVNVNGTLNLLEAARKSGSVKRFVYAASSSAYGNQTELPKGEAVMPSPLSPYAVSKVTGEYYAQVYSALYGMPCVCLRYFNVFGPRQDPDSAYAAVISRFVSLMLKGKALILDGDGLQTRDFTYVDNVVDANMRAATVSADKVSGQVINVATGKRVSLMRLVDLLRDMSGCEVNVQHGPPRSGDVRHSQADITLATDVLGYEPLINFPEGLKRYYEWFVEASQSES